MMRTSIHHTLVEFIPEQLEEGVLYVSEPYGTAVHLCCCGCGQEVVTPLTPTDWTLNFNEKGATLNPSVGNWSFPCRSHYWVRRGSVIWAEDMTQEYVDRIRATDKVNKHTYYESQNGSGSAFGRFVSRCINEVLTVLNSWFKH